MNRFSFALAVLTGSVTVPASLQQWRTDMATIDDVKAQVTALEAALARATATKSSEEATIAADTTQITADKAQIADLQQNLSDALAQVTALLQPVVDQANTLAPAPASGAAA